MTPAESLEAAVRAGDEEAVRQLLGGLPEAERAGLQLVARAIVAADVRKGIDRVGHLGPMLLVAYGTLPVSDLRKLGWRSNHLPTGIDVVLRNRSAERLEPIAEHLLDDVGGRAWPAVRALVRDGVLPRPDRPSYTISMLAATRYQGASAVVAADPGLLDDEVWRLFEVEGGGEDSLASHEKYTGDSWGELFRTLAASDPVMRRRLLDASLAALAHDFGTFRAGWFSRFHESLAPGDDERAERSPAYLGLLRSRSAPTVSFAVAALGHVSRSGTLPPGELLGHVDPVLADAPAGTAKVALALVERAGRDPGHASEAALAATSALSHASADVQRAALRIIDDLIRSPDEAVAHALTECLPELSASQRPAAMALLERLAGAPSSATVPAAAIQISSRPSAAERPSVLDPARAIEPLASVDQLVDVGVSIVESGEPADDVERILDAVGRFAAHRPEGFERLTAPLARRARTILGRRESAPFAGFDARADVAAVLGAWTSGTVPGANERYRGIDPGAGAFLSARAHEVATAASARVRFQTVCAPTHAGGVIDPGTLVERLAERPPASRLDLVAAILRLAPDGRDDALRTAGGLAGEVGATVRYALGGEEQVGPTAAWWIAAARVRAPGRDDERVEARHSMLGPDAGRAARVAIVERRSPTSTGPFVLEVEPAPPARAPVDLPTVLMLGGMSSFARTGRSEPAMLRWMATIQPAYREAWAARGSVALASNLDWWSAEWSNRVFLEPFVDPASEFGSQAQRLIGIALGAREAGERGLATDIVRLAIADERLTAAGLAEGLTAAAALGCDRPGRWAQSLGDVGGASDAHARAVADAVAGTLPALSGRPPGGLVSLLRLLDELLAETSGSVARAGQDMLTSLTSQRGQAGRLARSILARGDVTVR